MATRIPGKIRERGARVGRRADLESLVGASSEKLRQFLFAYLLVLFYVVAVVFATTDRQLLLADEGLKLPLIDLRVPLVGFFAAVPILVMALHFNLLQNYSYHVHRLIQLRRTYADAFPVERIGPLIVDVATLSPHTSYSKWVSVTSAFLCFYSGPTAIVLMLWRFADYQSPVVLALHAATLWLDLLFIAKARGALLESEHRRKSSSLAGAIEFVAAPVGAAPTTWWGASVWYLLLAVVVLKVAVCWDVFVRDWEDSFFRRHLAQELRAADQSYGDVNDLWGLLPRIAIDRTDWLFKADVSQLKAQAEIVQRREWLFEFEHRGVSIDLRRRSLRYLSIPHQLLPRLWAQDADLQGANLSFTVLTGAVLGKAQMQGADLSMAQLDGAYLNEANLRGADLVNADLSGSFAPMTQFQGANLRGAMMKGMLLQNAGLEGAVLTAANLDGSYVNGLRVWGAADSPAEVLVLTRADGVDPELSYLRPSIEAILEWSRAMPGTDEDDFLNWMTTNAASSRFSHLKINDKAAIDGLLQAACNAYGQRRFTRIALARFEEMLLVLSHVAHSELMVGASKAQSCAATQELRYERSGGIRQLQKFPDRPLVRAR